ncbi:MAG TPA: histidine phosphatase family protein [Mycobacterium sp.]|nr:histidine phosphatase family protein [Mycobacterium sp.]
MRNRTRSVIRKAATALAAAMVLGACSGGPHQRTITLTFIRHAESENNAAGVIDTSIPGPGLTKQGRGQAEQIARQLQRNHYDGVYASSMLRAQQTAAPMAKDLGRQVQVLPGLREIDAGWYDGEQSSMADSTYLLAPVDWLRGDRTLAVPGSVDGNQFNERFSAAVQRIYDTGDAKPVAFSHGAAIMTWTLMNVKNPRDDLMTDHPLPNIGRVVITGNPNTGWRLIDWDGISEFN